MKPIVIKKINGDIEIIHYDKEYKLADDVRDKIDNYWNNLLNSGKTFTRGVVFTINKIENIDKDLKVYLESTDYAHYLYTINNKILEDFACRVIYTSILVETLDSKLIIGEMAFNTATPNRLQCCGGGFDNEDIIEGKIDIYNNIRRELYEELGIDLLDTNIVSNIQPKYIQSGGENNFIGLVFKVELKINEKEYVELYEQHVKKLKLQNIVPEFSELVFIKSDIKSIKGFLEKDKRSRADYLEKLIIEEANWILRKVL